MNLVSGIDDTGKTFVFYDVTGVKINECSPEDYTRIKRVLAELEVRVIERAGEPPTTWHPPANPPTID